MALNADPIYIAVPNIGQGGAILGPSANTAQDGTGANITRIFEAGTNGSWVESVTLKSAGSPAATVARIWYMSATGTFTPGTTNTAANTTMIAEIALPAITTSNTLAQNQFDIPLRKMMESGHGLLITFGTSTGASGTGFGVTVWGGDY